MSRLLEIIVTAKERGGVRVLVGTVKDAHEVEVPHPVAVLLGPDRRLDRDLVADLPAEALGGLPAHDGTGPRFQPRLLLLRRKEHLRMHVQKFLRHDRILHEEVLRVLVDAAEPGLVGCQHDAGDPLHPCLVALGQQLDDRYLVPHDQPVRSRHGHPAGERLLDGRQVPEEDKRHDDGEQRQQRAQLLALQIAPDEIEVAHGERRTSGWPVQVTGSLLSWPLFR